MTRKLRIGNEPEGIIPANISATIEYLHGGTKEHHENPHILTQDFPNKKQEC
jgi:hypothetical protein